MLPHEWHLHRKFRAGLERSLHVELAAAVSGDQAQPHNRCALILRGTSSHLASLLQPPVPIGNAGIAGLVIILAEHRRQLRRGLPSQPADQNIKSRAEGNPVLKAGRLCFNKGKESFEISGTVRSLSRSGAAVDVLSSAGIPDRIALVIDADATSRLCDIASKSNRRLDLAFES